MHAAKVPVDERIAGLGLVVGADREAEMPGCVVVPTVPLEEPVAGLCVRLDVAPVAVEHVLLPVDELAGMTDRPAVHVVLGHACELTDDPKWLQFENPNWSHFGSVR